MSQLPTITVQDVAQKIERGDDFYLIDVREMNEIDMVTFPASFLEMALSDVDALDEDAIPEAIEDKMGADIVVLCHHGSRSATAANWLISKGYTNVKNMMGGIHAYAIDIEPSIGTY